MSSSEQSFYNRYWGEGGIRSADAPAHRPSDGEAFFKKFGSYYRGAAGDRALLDLGCGEGDFLAQARTAFAFKTGAGADVSDHVLGIARGKHPELEFHQIVAGRLPFADAAFDVVQSMSVLEHVLDLPAVLGEVARVLKPGGHFICYTTDFNWLKQVLIAALFWDKYFDPLSPHVRYLKRESLRKLLEAAGLHEVHYSWNGSYWGIMPEGMIHISQKGPL
jgi:ubiquinone/menaquinone biosynthesis C-methylase UbiE